MSICLVLVSAAGAGWWFILSHNAELSSDTLSARAQEYMDSRRKADDGVWRNVVTTPRGKKQNQEVSLSDCFTVRVPFEVRYTREAGHCVHRVGLMDPAGSVVLQIREGTFSSLDEVSDVQLRRSKPEVYEERSLTVNGRSYIAFVSRQDGYEQTALTLTNRGLFTLSLIASTSEDLSEKFATMIETVEIY